MDHECPKCKNKMATGYFKGVKFLVYENDGTEHELYETFYVKYCPNCEHTEAELQ